MNAACSLNRLVLVAACAMAIACSANPDAPSDSNGSSTPSGFGPAGQFTLSLDGKPATFTSLDVSHYSDSPARVVIRADNDISGMSQRFELWVVPTTGIQRPSDPTVVVMYIRNPDAWAANDIHGSGSISVTSVTSTSIAGSFDLTLTSDDRSSSLHAQGSFAVNFACKTERISTTCASP